MDMRIDEHIIEVVKGEKSRLPDIPEHNEAKRNQSDGDDVAVGKVRIAEDGAEEALGQHMLDEHLLDGFER